MGYEHFEKCLNILVLYDNGDEVCQYIENVLRNGKKNVDFLLVVNKDKQHARHLIENRYRKNIIKIIDYGENVGYLNSLLLTLPNIDIDSYKYIILSNTDIAYKTEDFFGKLLSKIYDVNIGCIVPDVFSPLTKCHSNPHYKYRLTPQKIRRNIFIFSHPILARCYFKLSEYRSIRIKKKKENSSVVYAPHGCYMIFTKQFAKFLKGKKYSGCLYTEEGCIAEYLLQDKKVCFYDSSLEVVHYEHGTTGKLKKEQQAKLLAESLTGFYYDFFVKSKMRNR